MATEARTRLAEAAVTLCRSGTSPWCLNNEKKTDGLFDMAVPGDVVTPTVLDMHVLSGAAGAEITTDELRYHTKRLQLGDLEHLQLIGAMRFRPLEDALEGEWRVRDAGHNQFITFAGSDADGNLLLTESRTTRMAALDPMGNDQYFAPVLERRAIDESMPEAS